MHGLELLLGLALLLLIVPIVSLVIGLTMRDRMRSLEARIGQLEFTLRVAGVEAPPHTPLPGLTRRPRRRSSPLRSPRRHSSHRPSLLHRRCLYPRPQPEHAGWGQLEGRLGGTWLNRIGALILVLGVGFFLKYAFDNQWIPPAVRVTLGILTGMVLIVVGEFPYLRGETLPLAMLGPATTMAPPLPTPWVRAQPVLMWGAMSAAVLVLGALLVRLARQVRPVD